MESKQKLTESFFEGFKIPKDWEVCNLEKIVRISKEKGIQNSLPYIEIGDIDTDLKTYSIKEKHSVLGCLSAKKNEIIISNVRPTRGAISKIFENSISVSSAFTILTTIQPKIITNDFLFYYLNQNKFFKYLGSKQKGTSYPSCKDRDITSYTIIIPPFNEQQKIVSILSNVYNLILQYDSIIKSTKQFKIALMYRLLVKGIQHEKFQKQKFCFNFLTDMFPTSWKNVKIKDISHVVRGGSPRPAKDPKYFGGTIPWIVIGELTKDDFMFLNSTKNGLTDLGSKHSRFLDKGTVVISNSGYTLGHPKILNISGCANDGIAAFMELDESIDPKFLYYSLKHWTKHLRNVNQGVFQVNLNTEILGNLYLPLPKIDEQHKIVAILSDYENYIKDLESKFVFLNLLNKGLMQKLLSGQIRVKI